MADEGNCDRGFASTDEDKQLAAATFHCQKTLWWRPS
jgi:hypothetical protein